MPSRYYGIAKPRLRQSGAPDITSREANDRRLSNAIDYLAKEGGNDSPQTYVERVEAIDDGILQQYQKEGYSYDKGLYKELRSMVREVQDDVRNIDLETSSAPVDDSDSSVEEIVSPDVLYRGGSPIVYPEVGESSRQAAARAPVPKRLPTWARDWARPGPPMRAEIRETEFLYGGPKNEVEEWHKGVPASLPFGETLYMQEWESMKIDYDLRESAKRLGTDADPIVRTNVRYEDPEAAGKFVQKHQVYDSGSRFKLPTITQSIWDTVSRFTTKAKLEKCINEFNLGGPKEDIERKDYAPRIFLPQFEVDVPRRSSPPDPLTEPVHKSSKALGKQPVRDPLHVAGPSKTTSKTGWINPEVRAQIQRHPQKGPRRSSFGSQPYKNVEPDNGDDDDLDMDADLEPITQGDPSTPKRTMASTAKSTSRKSIAGKLAERRAATVTSGTQSKLSKLSTPKSGAKVASHVHVSPKKTRGYVFIPTEPEPEPESRKRKAMAAEAFTAAKKAKAAPAKKVAFATVEAGPSKKTASTKSATKPVSKPSALKVTKAAPATAAAKPKRDTKPTRKAMEAQNSKTTTKAVSKPAPSKAARATSAPVPTRTAESIGREAKRLRSGATRSGQNFK